MIGNERRGKARLTVSLVLLSVTAVPTVAQVAQDTLASRTHVVRRGDTLWDLARAYLDNPFMWRLIYDANRDVVENPHWIYPGLVLRLRQGVDLSSSAVAGAVSNTGVATRGRFGLGRRLRGHGRRRHVMLGVLERQDVGRDRAIGDCGGWAASRSPATTAPTTYRR